MKPAYSTGNDENRGVLFRNDNYKSFRTYENHSFQNDFSSSKNDALLSRAAYSNVFYQKPIFKRKLIEKYSTARHNFNHQRIYSVQTDPKKKFGYSNYSFGKPKSKNTRYCSNRAVIFPNYITDLSAQFVDSEKSFFNNRRDTITNSTDCRVTVPKQSKNSASTRDESERNPKAKSVPSRPMSDCIENEKTSKNVPAHAECKSSSSTDIRCEVYKPESTSSVRNSESTKSDRALISSSTHLTKSTHALADSGSSKNGQTSGSSLSEVSDIEDSDSDESTYLTVSYDGDSDSRFSLISDESFEESYDSPKFENSTELSLRKESNSESPKTENKDLAESAAQHLTDSSVTVKNTESHFSSKRSFTNTAPPKLPDSDSDSGLQLCSSDGEKSSPDQHPSDFARLLTGNAEKPHKHQFSVANTDDWVSNSCQNLDQSKLDSGSNVLASSALIVRNDHADEHLSSDSNAVLQDKSTCALSNLSIEVPSLCDSERKAETSKADNSIATCFKPTIGSDEEKLDNSNQKQLAEQVTKSSNCDKPGKLTFEETAIPFNVCDNNSCEDSVLFDDATSSEYKKSTERWKLVPSSVYQHFARHYETPKIDMQTPSVPKKKKKKSCWKNRRKSAKKSVPAEKVSEKPVDQDPYVETLKELEIKEELTNESSKEKIGMILHVGVNRPLFPEVYRNIITLNEKTDGEITSLWANFALSTLITDKSSKRFRSVFMPVIDPKLKSTIDEYQKKTCRKFQEVDLQKVTFVGSPEEDIDDPSNENDCPRKRKNSDSLCDSDMKLLLPDLKLSPKKQKMQISMPRSLYPVDFPAIQISALDTSPKSNYMLPTNYLTENSKPAAQNSSFDFKNWETASQHSIPAAFSEPSVEKLSDEALLAKHGYKPCWVLLHRIPIPRPNTYAEEDEEDDDEDHLFGENHCSRTHGQMFDYRSRNLSLVFFHRIKRILRLQKQNNKLFGSCRYVHLQPAVEDEFIQIDLLDNGLDTIVDSFPAEVTTNPLDILGTRRLNLFEAPLLNGIDVNANKFPIRFMNHQLLKSETNAKWFILQLNKCMRNVIHHNKDHLPVELLFQTICRADLTKKVVCNAIGVEFDPDALNFGVYGVPGFCEAVLIGPYESREMQHDLTATVVLGNGETACIPILETSFDADTFFLWSEEAKVRSVCGLWWKPGDAVPCTSAANSAFLNHLFNPADSESRIEFSVRVQPLLKQHPCLSYTRYDRGSQDMNIRLIHQAVKLNYTTTGMKVSERMAVEDFLIDDFPLLLSTKLRRRTNVPNYRETVSPKTKPSAEPKSDVFKESKMPARRAPVRVSSNSQRLKMKTKNDRLSRKEFSALRSNLSATVETSKNSSLVSILSHARNTVNNLARIEDTLKRGKRSLFLKRKKLIDKIRMDTRHFPRDHPCFRNSVELISKLGKCDRAENFAKNGLSKVSIESSNYAVTATINSDDVRSAELSEKLRIIESSKSCSTKKLGPAVASKHYKLGGARKADERLTRKGGEWRFKSLQQSVSESSGICSSPEEELRSEHSYCRRATDLADNSGCASDGIARQQSPKSRSPPSPLVIRCDQQWTDSSEERDEVAVYLTEDGVAVTKLIIRRSKSANESARHLMPVERRNRTVALIRQIVRETLASTCSRANSSDYNRRVVVPRLLLLLRMLEGANTRIRDRSRARVIDETVEISDDDDQDEFSIEASGAADGQLSQRRVYVKVSSAGSTPSSSPLQNGITSNSPAPVSTSADLSSDRADQRLANDLATVNGELLFVDNQITLNHNGDQVDTSADGGSPKPRRPRGPSNASRRKVTVLKRVNGAVKQPPNGNNVSSEVNPVAGSSVKMNPLLKPTIVGISDVKKAQDPGEHGLPVRQVRLLRNLVSAPPTPASPPVRLYARKTFTSPNYRKMIAQRRAMMEMLSPSAMSAVEPSMEYDSTESSPGAEESSISDCISVHPDLLGQPMPPNKSPSRFKPNILVKNCKGKASIVVPLNGKKVSLPVVLAQRCSAEERLRCPSFVPPSVHSTSSAEMVTEEVPHQVVSPVEAGSPLEDDANAEGGDLCVENGSLIESSTRQSSTDLSTRLAIKSFASVRSFNDNCFSNMDRMLKF